MENFQGIGDKTAKLYAKLLGGARAVDVLWHLPVDIIERPRATVEGSIPGSHATLRLSILSHNSAGVKRNITKVMASDGGEPIFLNFFHAHADYIARSLPVGSTRFVSGRIELFNGQKTITHPEYITANAEEIPQVEPVYPLTAGISNRMMGTLARKVLDGLPKLPEWQNIAAGGEIPSFQAALRALHEPMEVRDTLPICPARRRLAYDEFLANQLALVIARQHMRRLPGTPVAGNETLRSALRRVLPFELTTSQQEVLAEIYADQASPARMIRLLQGDVGSGKTIVSLFAALNAVEAGGQAAVMAPTDLLARQHFATLTRLTELLNVRVELLTGKDKGARRAKILDGLAGGSTGIVVGTHALFQEDVAFANLRLAVIDEQHRFGVEQRMRLAAKGDSTDILLMTATPIPRSLALVGYGDMEVSTLRGKPAGRQPVETSVMSVDRAQSVMDGLARALARGDRAYWLCPLVEESEKSDLAAAVDRHEKLNALYPGQAGLVHGRMKTAQREAEMARFASGEVKILVATTVIEVGVDVPEAAIMVVERAERFGLAQLHQLRGRVGRGARASHCLLLYGLPCPPVARERLAVMKASQDGFEIAEKDLEMRGSGEVLGTKQSGQVEFKVADLIMHQDLLLAALKDVRDIMASDRLLQSPRGQALAVLLYLFGQDEAIRTLQSG
ncbi:ATP-dependent DNA helicase RecG [Alphaproteobacteria bacterium]|nr:ATP-dependent DNA helicase RecG [Alphaproteobacteria bacterium]